MKKLMIALAATLMMSASAMAQDDKNAERKQFTKEQMVQKRTEGMVKKYELNEEQAAKLQELNAKYADMRFMSPRGNRPGRMHRGDRDFRPAAAPDSLRGKGGRPEHNKADFQDMRKKMEEYDAQLKAIMTEEQYATYKADREKMMQRGPRPGNNQHKDDDKQ